MTHPIAAELRQVPVFARLHRRELQRIDSLMTPLTFADGDVLLREDQIGREAFVIVGGEVAVSRGDDYVTTLGPGDIVGETALLTGRRRSATVTATAPVTAYVMDVREFASVLAIGGVGDAVRRVAERRERQLAAA